MSPKKILSTEEAVSRRGMPRLGASMSFNEEQITALDLLFSTLLRGGDVRAMKRSKALVDVAAKLPTMKATIERQRERRAARAKR